MSKYDVSMSGGLTLAIDADKCEVQDDGSVHFTSRDGDVTAAFAAGSWQAIVKGQEAQVNLTQTVSFDPPTKESIREDMDRTMDAIVKEMRRVAPAGDMRQSRKRVKAKKSHSRWAFLI